MNAFWSVTMYDGKTQLLIENPINRYLINSPMLPGMKKNADGSLTLYIQNKSPGADKEANWLPAPDGPIYLVMRLYWPKTDAALDPAGGRRHVAAARREAGLVDAYGMTFDANAKWELEQTTIRAPGEDTSRNNGVAVGDRALQAGSVMSFIVADDITIVGMFPPNGFQADKIGDPSS